MSASAPGAERRGAASRAGLAAIAAKVCGAAMALVVNVAIARLLGPEGFGLYAFGIGLASTLAVVATLGMPFAAIRHLPDYLARGDWPGTAGFTRASIAASFLGAGVCAVLMLAMSSLAAVTPEMSSVLAWSAALLVPMTLGQTIATLLQARGHVVAPELVQSAARQGATMILLAMALSLFSFAAGAETALATTGLASAGAAAALWLMLGRVAADEPRGAARYDLSLWAKTGGSVLLILTSSVLTERLDVLMLGWLVEPAALGQYAAAARLASVAMIALAGLNAAYMPRVSRAWAEGDRAGTQRLCQEAALIGVGLTGAMMAGAAVLGGPALGLFGPEFRDASGVLMLLLATQCGLAISGIAGGLAVVAGLDRLVFFGVLAGLAGNAALNLALTPVLGITGTAIATMLSLTVTQLVIALRCGRILELGTTALAPLLPARALGRTARG